MLIETRLRRRASQIFGPVFAAALVAYFAYYTVEGERGLLALTRLQARAADAEATYAEVKAEHERLDLKVRSLRPDSLDPDRLDEQSRVLLNNSRRDEVIIILPKSSGEGH